MSRSSMRVAHPIVSVATLVALLLALGAPLPGRAADDVAAGQPAWAAEARIYHLFPDRFRDADPAANVGVDDTLPFSEALRDWMGGDIAGVREGLDHIQGLGFNTIWLGPVYEGPYFHGYHPVDLLGVDPNFGDVDGLRALVDEVHARGMRIVYDLVLNHTSDQHPWFQDVLTNCQASPYYSWYRFDDDCTDYESFFGIDELPELDLDDPGARAYMLDVVVPFYLEDMGFDGFRLDYALGPSMDFWAAFRDKVDAVDPEAHVFAEVWDARDVIASYADVFDAALNFPLHDAFKATLAGSGTLRALDSAIREDLATYGTGYRSATFLDNHDVERFVHAAGGDAAARDRLELALTVQFALPWAPIVYQGTEIGMGQSGSGPAAVGGWEDRWYREPMPWDDAAWAHDPPLQTPDDDVTARVAALNAVRAARPVLVEGDYLRAHASDDLLVFERADGTDRLLVVVHRGGAPGDVDLAGIYGSTIPDGVTLSALLGGGAASSSGGGLSLPVGALHAEIYEVAGPLPAPDAPVGPPGGADSVTVAGSFQDQVGCPEAWDPGCRVTDLHYDAGDDAWEAAFDLPAGDWAYKAVRDRDWSTSFPDGDVALSLGAPETVSFLFDDATGYVMDTVNRDVVTVAGNFQQQAGCAGDWDPTCLRTWLQDPEGDGVYEWTTTALDAGTYETKAVVGRSWDEAYGPDGDGTPGGPNLVFTVPIDGARMTFTFDRATNVLEVGQASAGDDQPERVVIAGSFQSELGCTAGAGGDWDPGCDVTGLSFDPDGGHWEATFVLPAGDHEYKAALDGSWDENYGADAEPGGPNIALSLDAETAVTFLYSHRTNWVTDDVNSRIVTVPGNYQSEVGCTQVDAGLANGDWEPACMVTWLQDPDGDGVYSFTTTAIPAGSYQAKAAVGRSWDENYGAPDGGVGTPDGPNVSFSTPGDGAPVTFSFVSATNVLTIEGGDPGRVISMAEQRAHWIREDVIAWPYEVGDGETLWLHHDADAGLEAGPDGIAGGQAIALTVDPAGLPAVVDERYRHLGGYTALRLPDDTTRDEVAGWLRGQLAVSSVDASGSTVVGTGVQIPGVLDDLYADAATTLDLGVSWEDGSPVLRLWAPTAVDVRLHRFAASQPADPSAPLADVVATTTLTRDDASGVWEVTGAASWDRDYYLYEVTVYVPETQTIETNLVTDPYSHSLSMDSTRSQIVDLGDPTLAPDGWVDGAKPAFDGHPVVYELHVRDFSAHDATVPADDVGTYRAFTHVDSDGMRHLAALAEAGLTHLHLLPTNDIATIPEDPADQVTPVIERPDDPASEVPQSIQQATRDEQPFNWGYDPFHYTVPEGGYATNPDGPSRILEFREMVQSLNGIGLRVVKDVVYNHTHAAGQSDKSVLDRVVPGYYQRLDEVGGVETSTCCPNTASEHRMMQQLMVDSVVDWAREYKVDGFRFDLMGHHTKENMLAVRNALDELTLADDGVDGSRIVLYGEGWDFGEVVDGRRFEQATQVNMAGTGIGTFNDRLRDAVRGGNPFGGLREQGWATGIATDPNGHGGITADDQLAEALDEQLWIQLGLAGNLADYELEAADGTTLRGDEILYGGSPAGYTGNPLDNVVYVSKHDNETLFDAIQMKAPAALSVEERVRMQNLALSVVAFSQGMPFFHAGSDLLRSKSLDRNSYNSGDWFNKIDWTGSDNNWGVGLPPEADNGASWDIHRETLRTAPGPDPDHIAANAAHFRELLRIRSQQEHFTLSSAAEVKERVRFHGTGEDTLPGLIVMEVTGEPQDLVVVFNARPDAVSVPADGMAAGHWMLHEVLRASADARVRTAAYADGAFTVPGRTTAVFVSTPAPGEPFEAELRHVPRRPHVGAPLIVLLEARDVLGDRVTGANPEVAVAGGSGDETVVEARALPRGRYLALIRPPESGTATITVRTADGWVLDTQAVEVRERPGRGRSTP